ncbi:HTH cro/C1-type domain-containing protein [Cupriavidus sp. H19C3]|uniref:Cro/Cl family transcriptional regulator n=1 Tax=Cupriavidus sp. H19C3 TaxID=3241603 RepID=UPI003BF78394
MRSAQYLDAVIERHGLKNDAELASHLGLVKSAISHYRTGRNFMNNEVCLKVAQALDMDNPLPIIMAADMDRAERAGQRSLWEVFSRRMAGSATPASLAVLIALATNFVSPTPAQASARATSSAEHSILC